jgi:hypothetical protein
MPVDYHIPSAVSYSWSSFPTVRADSSVDTWLEALLTFVTPSLVAVGINQVEKSTDDKQDILRRALYLVLVAEL